MDSWEDQVRRFMLDEEEEDDELFLVMVPALIVPIRWEDAIAYLISIWGRKGERNFRRSWEMVQSGV